MGRKPSTDGRVRRAERTKAAIIEAHVDLIREGTFRPTAREIADKAGVSVRTLWGNFGDMETLLTESVKAWILSDESLREPIDPSWPLARRIEAFCDERERRMKNLSPGARAVVALEHTSEALGQARKGFSQMSRREISMVFADVLGESACREQLLDALVLVSSWEAWSLLHDVQGLPARRCRDVLQMTLRTLLGEDASPIGRQPEPLPR